MKMIVSVLAAMSLALSNMSPALHTLAAPSGGTVGALVPTTTLSHAPRYGVDVKFAVPPGQGWADVASDDQVTLERLHINVPPGAKILAAWRALDTSQDRTYPERPYIYLYASAIPLDNRSDVKTPEDVARLALGSFCTDHAMCDVTPAASIPAGDIPTAAYTVRDAHVFNEDTNVDGYVADFSGGGEAITRGLECRSEQVFAIAGNWGYQFNLITTQPKALSSRIGDLKEVLQSLVFNYQPAAPAPEPAPAAPAPAAAAPSVISHVPVVGPNGDLQFDLPAALGWRHTDMAGNLNGIVPMDLLQGEYQLGAERALASEFGGAYIYFVATATSLDARPDIKTADDLAQAKFAFASKYRAAFQASAGTDGTVGGIPARMYRSAEKYEFNDQPVELNEITGAFGDSRTATSVTWIAQRAIAVRGNWAYEFRLTSTEEGALATRMADFETLLSTVHFNY